MTSPSTGAKAKDEVSDEVEDFHAAKVKDEEEARARAKASDTVQALVMAKGGMASTAMAVISAAVNGIVQRSARQKELSNNNRDNLLSQQQDIDLRDPAKAKAKAELGTMGSKIKAVPRRTSTTVLEALI